MLNWYVISSRFYYLQALIQRLQKKKDDDQGSRYVSLTRNIYRLANASTSLPLLSISIIRTLFLNLKEDALAFLAGTLVCNLKENMDRGVCVTAMRHIAAFMTAQPHIDFQNVLPSLVVAIADNDADVRQAALDCIAVMAANHTSLVAVYGFDTIYGEDSSNSNYRLG